MGSSISTAGPRGDSCWMTRIDVNLGALVAPPAERLEIFSRPMNWYFCISSNVACTLVKNIWISSDLSMKTLKGSVDTVGPITS